MKLRRPRSLYGLILVGFGLVALPLLLSVTWALFNLDRVAAQSEDLVFTGVSTADNNRLLHEHLSALERVSLQYQVLRNPDSLQIMRDDVSNLVARLEAMGTLIEDAGADALAASIEYDARAFISALADPEISDTRLAEVIASIRPLERSVDNLTAILSSYVDSKMLHLQETARSAQRVSAWQIVALVPGTLILVLIFTLLVARPISQIDRAIRQLGQSGFAKPIEIKGPTDLERLGRQLDWLRVRLLELAQEKNKFLRHMSHELKTPLANIREGTELLLDGSVGELDEPQREVSDILRTNGIKLQQLIENLLAFSAWQTKSQILTLSEFPLREQIAAVAKTHRLALTAAHIQLKLEVDDIVVYADRDKIRTVADNLLSNAIKFTPQDGFITIRAYGTPTGFMIEFGDTGPGIPADESPLIFDAFFQGSLEQGGQVGGTGIGLSVVQECVQAHEGSVELVNSEEFPGAHFRIHIPQKHGVRQQQLAVNG